MLAAALMTGTILGIGFDARWFFSCALKLPLRPIWDLLYLLASLFLLFTLFQYCGVTARIDILCFALGAAVLYEAVLGGFIRDRLGRLATLMQLPFKYLKNLLKKVIKFMKKILANVKNWFMIKKRASCLRAGLFHRQEKERIFAIDNGGSEAADSYPDPVRVVYAAERGLFIEGGPTGVGTSARGGGDASGRKRAVAPEHKRKQRRRKMGVHSQTTVGPCKSR